ncbi:MAG: hypothetical protein CM15mP130_2690 [Verrucomicrobiota bacterium]|nr:MAG: hypothetical protein CM15mP130_2690 [Verrucomicrobiota bacterium]
MTKSSLPESVLEDLHLTLKVEHNEDHFVYILEAENRSNEGKSSPLMFINKSVKLKEDYLEPYIVADYDKKSCRYHSC